MQDSLRVRVVFLEVFLSAILAAGAAADPSLVTPTPKKMALSGETVPVAGGRIVLAGTGPKLRAAAEEINQRLTEELGARALPVSEGGLADVRGRDVRGKAGPVIVIGVSGAPDMAGIERRYPVTVPNRTEGYGYACHGTGARTVAVLSGHDAQGALYAAVTLRYLLDPSGGSKIANGTALLRVGTVEDWPDFRWRQIGNPPRDHYWTLKGALREGKADQAAKYAASFIADNKAYVHFLLRRKINMGWTPAPRLLTLPAEMLEHVRAVNDYARARGVDYVVNAQTNIGTYPQDKDDPRRSRCIDNRVHKRYFCWSLLDEHKERARRFADAMKTAGFRWLYLHDVDSGSWENPALWNDRCEHCRAMYGDDHARANSVIFGMYNDTIKRLIPDFTMIAVVYPYNGGNIDPDTIEAAIVAKSGPIPDAKRMAKEIAEGHQRMVTRLGRMLDPAVKICQREVPREHYDLMTRCYGPRDFQIYLEFVGSRERWMPEFSMGTGWIKTFYRPGHEDVFYAAHQINGYNFMSEFMAAEFGWNKDAPGSAEYPGSAVRQQGVDHHNKPRDISTRYVRRFCVDFWGPQVGPHMVPVFDSNISYRFIQRPDVVAENMRMGNLRERMQQMVEATAGAMESLEEARKAYDAAVAAGRRPIPDIEAERFFGDFYRFALAARAVAPFRASMMDAKAAVIGGDMEKAKALVAQMRSAIAREKAAWDERWPWMEKVPHHPQKNPRWLYTYGQFWRYDYSVLGRELAEFDERKDAIYEAYNVPGWFKKALSKRVLYAVPAPAPPVIDGRLDEKIWTTAPKNEFFVNYKTSTPAEKETAARVLYDVRALYVGYTIYEPGADRIRLPKLDRDDVDRSHSVELFVDANGDRQTYVQFMWDAAGNVLDGRRIKDAEGMLKLDNRGFTSRAEFAVAKYPDRWTLEARIPAGDLGGSPEPNAAWRANLCRNLLRSDGETESVSTVMMEGSRFHTPEKFAQLRFLRRVPPEREPVVNMRITKKKAGQVTIATGTGFESVFDIQIDTTKHLHDASLRADVFSGDARKGALTVFQNRDIQLLWRTRRPIRHLVDTPEDGLEFAFRLEAREGHWTFSERFGAPPPRAAKASFTEGVSGRALAGTAHFPAVVDGKRLFDSRQGTLETWVKVEGPLDSELRFGPDPQHVLFFQGPVRPDHPALDNLRSVCVRRVRRSFVARVTTKLYQSVTNSASLRDWRGAGWHHVAAQWSAVNEDELAFDLYLDGRKASGAVSKKLRDKLWNKVSEPFFVQLGSTITGACPLGWAIDEVRVSSAPRYANDFTPARRAELDAQATVVFHFDGNLEGETAGGAVAALAGPGR